MLKVALASRRRSQVQEVGGEPAERKLSELLGGNLVLANSALDTLAADLYEWGRKGAETRWVGKVVALDLRRD